MTEVTSNVSLEPLLEEFAHPNDAEAVILLNHHFHIVSLTPAAERLLGWSTQDATGRACSEVLCEAYEPQAHGNFAEPRRNTIIETQNGERIAIELRERKCDGHTALILIPDRDGLASNPAMVSLAAGILSDARSVEHCILEMLKLASDCFASEASCLWLIDGTGVHLAETWRSPFRAGNTTVNFPEACYPDAAVFAERALGGKRCRSEHSRPSDSAESVMFSATSCPIAHAGKPLGVLQILSLGSYDATPQKLEWLHFLAQQTGQLLARRHTEEQLQATTQRSNALLHSALDCIIATNPDGTIFAFNPAAEHTFGYRAEETIGRLFEELVIPPRHRESHRRRLQQYLSNGTGSMVGQRHEITAMRSDESEFPAEISIVAHGEPGDIRFTAFLRDITDRVTAERQLRESKERLEALVSIVPIGIGMALDSKGETVMTNPRLATMLGIEPGHGGSARSTAGQEPAFVCYKAGRVLSDSEFPLHQACVTGQEVHEQELEIVRADGERIFVQCSAAPLFGEGGTVRGSVAAFADVTARKLVEDEIHASREHLSVIYETAPLGIAEVDLSGRFRSVNRRYCEITGYREEELYDITFHDITHPEDVELDFEKFNQLLGGEVSSYMLEKRYLHKSGNVVWIELHATLVRDKRGTPLYRVTTAQDITDRKAVEDALRRSDERLRRIFHSNVLGMVVEDFNGRVREANDAFLNLVGYSREELERGEINLLTITPHEYRERDYAARDAMRADGQHQPYEKEFVRKDGFRVPVLVGTAYMGDDEELGIGLVVDLSEQKQAEAALRHSEQLYRGIGESIDYGIWVCDASGRNIYASESFLKLVGQTQEECSSYRWARALHPEDSPATLAHWKECVRTGASFERAHRYRGADGRWHYILARGVPVRDDQGKVAYWAGINLDIDRIKKTEEALQQANRRKDEFLAMLAHELRNPMAGISGALRLVRSPKIGDAQRAWAQDVMERQLKQLTRLLDDLLDVSRITRGKIHLKREIVDLAEIVERAVEVCRPNLEGQRHELELDVTDGGVLHVLGDPTRLEQIFVNLLNNAVKYTQEGGHISLAAERVDNFIEVKIVDSGVGIPPDLLPRIFEPFIQGHPSLDRSHGGLGIGLTLVKRLVEMHGGIITVCSEVGRGSEFTLRFPRVSHTLHPSATQGLAPAIASRSLRILVVDDNRDAAQALALLLHEVGHRTELAFDGPTALAAAQKGHPDAVLLDIGLPGMDGYAVARALRADPAFEQTLLVAISGYGQPKDRKRALEAGFDHHLLKPVDHERLLNMLAQRSAPLSVLRVGNS